MPKVPDYNIVTGLAAGLDRNDGLGGRGGVASLPQQLAVNAAGGVTDISNIAINELPSSPVFERAEQCTVTKQYQMSWVTAQTYLQIYGRGVLVYDSGANYYRVLSSRFTMQNGGKGIFELVCESISFDAPPDKFSIRPVKMGIDILKYPRYYFALIPTNQLPSMPSGVDPDTDDQIRVKQQIIRAIQAYRDNPVFPSPNNISGITGDLHDRIVAELSALKQLKVKANPNFNPKFKATNIPAVGTTYASNLGLPYPAAPATNGDENPPGYYEGHDPILDGDPGLKIAMAGAAALELIQKLWRMEDSPMINIVEITLTQFWFRPPPITLGGYTEDIFAVIPDYFYSTAYPPNPSQTILNYLTYLNPQCYSATGIYGGPLSISALRDADSMVLERTFFEVTSKWLVAFTGCWDADFYSQGDRPQFPTDYKTYLT